MVVMAAGTAKVATTAAAEVVEGLEEEAAVAGREDKVAHVVATAAGPGRRSS